MTDKTYHIEGKKDHTNVEEFRIVTAALKDNMFLFCFFLLSTYEVSLQSFRKKSDKIIE